MFKVENNKVTNVYYSIESVSYEAPSWSPCENDEKYNCMRGKLENFKVKTTGSDLLENDGTYVGSCYPFKKVA